MLGVDTDEKWDFCPQPIADESFLSWFVRLAKENCSDVGLLYQKLRGSYFHTIRVLNREKLDKYLIELESSSQMQDEMKKILSSYINIPLFQRSKTLVEFMQKKIHPWDYFIVLLPSPRYCVQCLQESEISYFPAHWFYKFNTYCDIHQCLMSDCCPHCYSPIKFWKSNWNQSLKTCFNCGNDITQGINIVSKIKATFQKDFYEVLNSGKFRDKKIDPLYFFRQLWRLVHIESKDPKVKDQHMPLTAERTFRALNLAYMCIERDKNRFAKPHFCSFDGLEFGTKIELDLHMFQKHKQEPVSDKIMVERYAMIKPFLEKGIMSKKKIMETPIEINVSNHSIYKWMLVYKKEGIKGLAQKQKKKKRKGWRFPPAVYHILEDHVSNFDKMSMSMNQCWKKIVKDCKLHGYESSQIPTCQTVRNKINFFRNSQMADRSNR